MFDTSLPVLAVVLAVLVAVVGMPHGGLDHRFGRALLRPALGRWWASAFAAGYLSLMGVVFAGWWLLPLLTVFLFVALSAAHFGTAEPDPPGSLVLTALKGGMVIWVPTLVQPVEFTRLLVAVLPDGQWPDELLLAPAARVSLAVMVAVAVASAFRTSLRCGLRVLGFAGVFAVAPPLVSFLLYFCGWHSLTELAKVARQADPSDTAAGLWRVVREASPLSAAAVLLIAAGWWSGAADRPVTPWLLQTVFVGLSVVAVPHMMLHWAAASRGVNPFSEAGR